MIGMETGGQISVGLVAQLVAFAGLIFTAIRFVNEKKREFQRKFFEEQLKTYTEAVDCSAGISIHKKSENEYRMARDGFRRLFWGKMCIVEDKDVEKKMVEFSGVLDQYDVEENLAKADKIRKHLRQIGLELAHTCRNSSLNTWKIGSGLLKKSNDYSSTSKSTEIEENS